LAAEAGISVESLRAYEEAVKQPSGDEILILADFFRCDYRYVFRQKLSNDKISGLFIHHPIAGRCVLVNYDEDLYRQRFTAAHECGHAILDVGEEFGISFGTNGNDLREVRVNAFASHYLLPPKFLEKLPPPRKWTEQQIVDWANKSVHLEAVPPRPRPEQGGNGARHA
jgi:Zn-dependent peptidase ImmA (M78 family)